MGTIRRIEFAPDLTEQVYQRLLEAISNGDIAPGTRLTQEELAASLNVSRQPVLQALRALKKEGFVADSGRRGLMVMPVSAQVIAQVYQVRSALDALAARLAALAKVKLDTSVIAEGRKAVASGRIGAMVDADLKFHNLVYAASGNALISETANHHWRHIRRAAGGVLQEAGVRETIWDEHEAILKAINRGDAERAERLARKHGEDAGHHFAVELDRQARAAS
ncbi:MAG: GntR family transcriptional regulator [Burkholderiales bacterium]